MLPVQPLFCFNDHRYTVTVIQLDSWGEIYEIYAQQFDGCIARNASPANTGYGWARHFRSVYYDPRDMVYRNWSMKLFSLNTPRSPTLSTAVHYVSNSLNYHGRTSKML